MFIFYKEYTHTIMFQILCYTKTFHCHKMSLQLKVNYLQRWGTGKNYSRYSTATSHSPHNMKNKTNHKCEWYALLCDAYSKPNATHTHPFNGPFSGTTQVSRYQKGKSKLNFTEARDSEWQRHQLDHMQVCISLQTDTAQISHCSMQLTT